MSNPVLVVGATGTIGSAVAAALATDGNEVITAARSGADHHLDISDADGMRSLFARLGPLAGIVSCAGSARFVPLLESSDEDWAFSLANKLMGQVNLVRFGAAQVAEGGAITLSTGVLANAPMPGSSILSTVNAGLQGFVRSCALDVPQLRVNAVSPGWVAETLAGMGEDPAGGTPAAEVAQVYLRAVKTAPAGEVLGVG